MQPALLARAGIRAGVGVADARRMVHYYRPGLGGRLVFGKGGGAVAFGGRVGARFDGASPRRAEIEAQLRRAQPALGELPIVASWRGPVDLSVTGMPFFSTRACGGVHVGVGYSGDGIVPSLRWAGGGLLGRIERTEDEGRTPPAWMRGTAATLERASVWRQSA